MIRNSDRLRFRLKKKNFYFSFSQSEYGRSCRIKFLKNGNLSTFRE